MRTRVAMLVAWSICMTVAAGTGYAAGPLDPDGDGLTTANETAVGCLDPNDPDSDGDPVPDNADNCPAVANPTQADQDAVGE